MIKFDFNTYVDSFLDKEKYNKLMSKKEEVITKFNNSNMIGWTKRIDEFLIQDINSTAKYIKDNFDCLLVIGIGGSFLGSYSFDRIFILF